VILLSHQVFNNSNKTVQEEAGEDGEGEGEVGVAVGIETAITKIIIIGIIPSN
jgi:hypothetical protein